MAIPTEPVGSVPRSRELQDAMIAHSRGTITIDDLNIQFDKAVRETIERSGSDLRTCINSDAGLGKNSAWFRNEDYISRPYAIVFAIYSTVLDRLLHHAKTVVIECQSYRRRIKFHHNHTFVLRSKNRYH